MARDIQEALYYGSALKVFVNRAANVKKVPFLGQDDDRLRGHRGQEVAVIESFSQHARRTLFGISRKLVFEIAAERRHEATGGRHRPPAFEST